MNTLAFIPKRITLGIFGKKPGLDLDEESYSPRRERSRTERERDLEQTQISSSPNPPPKVTMPTMPPHRPAPMMPSVTTATVPEITVNAPAKESAAAPAKESMAVPPKESAPKQESKSMSYSIEDVIRLMRDLPDSKKEMVVIIVQKTLLSAKIDINTILEDAGRRVEKLQKQNDRLVSEIRDLEEAIILKKGEVDNLAREIEEIGGVKGLFENVYSRHLREELENKDKDRQVTAPPVPGSGNAGGF